MNRLVMWKKICITLVLFLLVSCKTKLYRIYERTINDDEEYIFVEKQEIKEAILPRNSLYYVMCDKDYHYFKIYNTYYPAKFVLNFKIVRDSVYIEDCENKINMSITYDIFKVGNKSD